MACVPIMLFVKPLLLALKHQNDPKPVRPLVEVKTESKPIELKKPLLSEGESHELTNNDEDHPFSEKPIQDEKSSPEPIKMTMPVMPVQTASHGSDEFDLSEVFVHQIIETIEFVLGELIF